MSDPASPQNIESILVENRVFPPAAEFAAKARVGSMEDYEQLYKLSIENPDAFWAKEAAELAWRAPWSTVLEWNCPEAKWFLGGRLNVAENCLDRHLNTPRRDKPAIVWEGEPGDKRTLTYAELHAEVCRFANVLKTHGIAAGDRVLIYLPLVPEAAVAMLACARIGAVHSVVFGGFSAESIKDRLADSGAKLIVTADGGWRRGKIVPLKANVDAALKDGDGNVGKVIVLRRTANEVAMKDGRDVWWHDETGKASSGHAPEPFDSEHPLFILYTSGSTGKPKGILHTTAGYLLGTYCTTKYVFDLREDDVYWCTADVGWITGHSYVVYGPLANGATVLMYEGAPDTPACDRWWKLIADYKNHHSLHAPTAIRAFIKWGNQWPEGHDLTSLRLLGTVGEPINPEAWMWFREKIGGGRCPIVDTWWQTETGGHMITPLPGATPTKPGTATRPFFGVDAAIVDDAGEEVGRTWAARLVIANPGRRCCGRSGVTRNGTRAHTGASSATRDITLPATARGATTREFLDRGPHRRCAQRGRTSPGYERDRKRAGGAYGGGRGGGGRQAGRDQGQGVVGVRDAQGRQQANKNWRTRSRNTSARPSARLRGRTRSVSRTRCPKRVRARSCGGC